MTKLRKLRKIVEGMGSVVVAYSGGLDSTFLLAVAIDVLGKKNVLAVTAASELYPEAELRDARRIARSLGARFITVHMTPLTDPRIRRNAADRCYHCKCALFKRFDGIRRRAGMRFLADGANSDDLRDIRQGDRAARECGVRRPLLEAGIGKTAIRRYSRQMRLPTWQKPSHACLASRVPFGTPVTSEALRRIERAEADLRSQGLMQVRVRAHGTIGRIEVPAAQLGAVLKGRKRVAESLRKAGFVYACMDLAGYRTGSMHEGEGA